MLYHLHVWGQERCIQGFGEEGRWIKDNFEDLSADGSSILKWIFKKQNGNGLKYIFPTQYSDK